MAAIVATGCMKKIDEAYANPNADVKTAQSLEAAFEETASDAFVVVTGSLHFVGHALQRLCPTDYPDERALNEYTLAHR